MRPQIDDGIIISQFIGNAQGQLIFGIGAGHGRRPARTPRSNGFKLAAEFGVNEVFRMPTLGIRTCFDS